MEDYVDNWFPDDESFQPTVKETDSYPMDDLFIAQIEKTLNQPITELMTYGVDLQELAEYVVTAKTVCECSYELQACIFALFPRWYIAQTPLRIEIYPDAQIAGSH